MNNLEKISSLLDNASQIAFSPVKISYVSESYHNFNQTKNDYIVCYILVNQNMVVKLQYTIQTDSLKMFILDNEKIKNDFSDGADLRAKNLYFANDLNEFNNYCQTIAKKDKEFSTCADLFLNNVQKEFKNSFPHFLFECEMILKQKNVMQKKLDKMFEGATVKEKVSHKL